MAWNVFLCALGKLSLCVINLITLNLPGGEKYSMWSTENTGLELPDKRDINPAATGGHLGSGSCRAAEPTS